MNYFFRGQHHPHWGEKWQAESSKSHLGKHHIFTGVWVKKNFHFSFTFTFTFTGVASKHFHCDKDGIGQDNPNFSGGNYHFSLSLFHIYHFHFHLYSHFQAMLAIQTNCATAEDCHKSYGISQSFLDQVKKITLTFTFHFFTLSLSGSSHFQKEHWWWTVGCERFRDEACKGKGRQSWHTDSVSRQKCLEGKSKAYCGSILLKENEDGQMNLNEAFIETPRGVSITFPIINEGYDLI